MDTKGIVTAALLAILLIACIIVYKDAYPKKEKDPHARVTSMTVDAFFIAILLAMAFVPSLGYIAVTPFLSFTLMHLPVLLGAALFGWKKGLLYGLIFGISSYVNALTGTGFNALFAFPWVAIPPRVAFGLISGILFSLIGKLNKKGVKGIYLSLVCFFMTILHTILVFLDLFLFHYETVSSLFFSSQAIAASFTFAAILGLGMLGEAILAAVIIPPLHLALTKAAPRIINRVKNN